MNTQPEALRLADNLDYLVEIGDYAGTATDAAAELRRLHALNAELVNDLRHIEGSVMDTLCDRAAIWHAARAAIAKAEAQQ